MVLIHYHTVDQRHGYRQIDNSGNCLGLCALIAH